MESLLQTSTWYGNERKKPHIEYLCEKVFCIKHRIKLYNILIRCYGLCHYIPSDLSSLQKGCIKLTQYNISFEAQKNLWNSLRYLHTWMNTICNRTTAWKHGHSLTTSLSKKLQQFIILTKVLLSLFGRPHKSFL